jgi:hypothetical protein
MARCETCGNNYDKAFEVVMAGTSHSFDSFECAIQALAPTCGHCGCRILGHGVEANGDIYCCAHCAGQAGVQGVQDRRDYRQSDKVSWACIFPATALRGP